MELNLVGYDDWRLYAQCEPWDFANPPVDTEEFATALVAKLRSTMGLGLAAPQVGMTYRAFAMVGGDEGDFVCFNPSVVEYFDETIVLDEGCLSYPGVSMKVNRHRHIRVRFQGPDGETYSKTFTNMTARVFQHELDHLDGVTLLNGPSRLKRDMAIKKASKLGYRYDTVTIRKSVEEAMMSEATA